MEQRALRDGDQQPPRARVGTSCTVLEVTVPIAFVGGLVSFLAPCVLPIIPGFLAYLAGTSVSGGSNRRSIFFHSLAFVLGFSFVFAVLGVLLNSVLTGIAYDVQTWLSRIGGAIVIFFGLYLTGLLKVGFLERPHQFKILKQGRSRYITSFGFGFAFAAGWTPCVGAVLGSILGLAAAAPNTAFALLLSYALGLGLPFLLIGFFAGSAGKFVTRYHRVIRVANVAFGVLLIVLGILVFTQNLQKIASFEVLNMILLREP